MVVLEHTPQKPHGQHANPCKFQVLILHPKGDWEKCPLGCLGTNVPGLTLGGKWDRLMTGLVVCKADRHYLT